MKRAKSAEKTRCQACVLLSIDGMDSRYTKLFEEVRLGNVTLKNRFIMAPMSTCDNLGFHMTDTMIRFIEERAKGGVAIIMTECQAVDKIDSMTSNYKTAGTPNQEKEWAGYKQPLAQANATMEYTKLSKSPI